MTAAGEQRGVHQVGDHMDWETSRKRNTKNGGGGEGGVHCGSFLVISGQQLYLSVVHSFLELLAYFSQSSPS
jgi:hypothetical protein